MMSQRPQPVTSKFRRYYSNDICPVYIDYNESSSSDSTSSLISVLHHDSFEENSIDSDCMSALKIEDDFDEACEESVSSQGLYCKRIIARQPHYPGARVTMTKHDGSVSAIAGFSQRKRIVSTKLKKQVPKSTCPKTVMQTSTIYPENMVNNKKLVRKTGNKSRSLSQQSSSTNKNIGLKEKSDENYSSNDFSSVSEVESELKISSKKVTEIGVCSSTRSSASLLSNNVRNIKDEDKAEEKSKTILTAWEAWYLKKEKEKRKIQEIELTKEKEKLDRNEEEKAKRTQICQEKIKSWLIKKDEKYKKELEIQIKNKGNENTKKEQNKEEMIKKSSEKYIAWKLEKKKKEKMLKKEESQLKIKLEAEKMIKQAKAANAFKRWFEEHKDHEMPVPYSYGISDGKLTSYYDKTSNPPPSFFNPDPWKPLIDIKN